MYSFNIFESKWFEVYSYLELLLTILVLLECHDIDEYQFFSGRSSWLYIEGYFKHHCYTYMIFNSSIICSRNILLSLTLDLIAFIEDHALLEEKLNREKIQL